MELFSSNEERDYLENCADLYSIFMACEVLEKSFVRDSVSAEEYSSAFGIDRFLIVFLKYFSIISYNPACTKLIAQYKTCINSLGSDFDVKAFVRENEVNRL